MTTTIEDAVRSLFPETQAHSELDPASPLSKHLHALSGIYTHVVASLCVLKNPRISALGKHIWNLTNRKITQLAIYDVRSLHFLAIEQKGTRYGFVFAPQNWPALYLADPLMEMGAVLNTGSQAVDFYNGRFNLEKSEVISNRAMSYEAEFLRECPLSQLNAYQQDALRKYPSGFEPRFDYAYRDVTASVA